MFTTGSSSVDLSEKLREIEEKLNRVISVQNTILDELATLKSRVRVEHREIRKLEYLVLSVIEEVKQLESISNKLSSRGESESIESTGET